MAFLSATDTNVGIVEYIEMDSKTMHTEICFGKQKIIGRPERDVCIILTWIFR
jgi:hypothetical protein